MWTIFELSCGAFGENRVWSSLRISGKSPLGSSLQRHPRKKIETTALWIDVGLKYINQMTEACRKISPAVTTEYPLLWNLMFVAERNFQELREDFRHRMATTQKHFILNRFSHDIRGININPYRDCPIVPVKNSDVVTTKRDAILATLLINAATTKNGQGQSVKLF